MTLRRALPALLAALAAAAPVCAQLPAHQTPPELQGVGIEEKLGARIDLSLEFIGEDGYPHALREYFSSGRPVILNLVYYSCPMLCSLVLNGQTEALRAIPQTAGREFEIVTVSIDPTENYRLAAAKRQAYLASYERSDRGWHFLADYRNNVARLAEQVGFRYRWDDRTKQYAHAAAIMVLSPDGMVSRYLYGVRFRPLDLRLALAEAAEGRTGVTEKILLYCFHYDPAARSYTLVAMNIMRAGGALALLVLGFALYRLWRRERLQAATHRNMVTAK
ncbi:MAG: SCO family protein [Bryobacteraceae bacterium]|nr:SCO family protein [Bryobacteraceae bacterium]